ncbi:MAG: NADH-quinone oxidoreductase subunit K [Proteobacteria bacterium]|nr:cation:proton antiporter [Desulfobacula sp.]MBU3951236.1 NADH-quinone oxidoreductase subunit K [Pseudomonadota bacterium]MBU4130263.1 NADH-quinone oxidoreductase subunit K [Pseudomonadota bacterium]
MESLLSLITGMLIAAGVYLMLERHILRILFGFILISNGVNLAILTSGRLSKTGLPIIPPGGVMPDTPYANPLSQALILTAIVIGFGVLIFCLVLAYKACQVQESADVNLMNLSEREEK